MSSPLLGGRSDTVVAEQVPQLPLPRPLLPGRQAGAAAELQVADGQITACLLLWLSCKQWVLDGPEK